MDKKNRDFSTLDSMISDDIERGYPGCVISVLKEGRILKKTAYGYKYRYDNNCRELKSPENMSLDTVFDLASNSKIYATVIGIMKLTSDGLLDIDEPIKSYIPEYIHQNITARQLLTHSSGYGPEIWFFDENNKYGKNFFSQDRKKTIELILREAPLEYITGKKSIYSDTGFMLLGILIERVSGLNQDAFLKKNIYNQLCLKNTTYNPLVNGISLENIAATSLGNTCNNTMDYTNIRTGVIRGEVQDEKAFYSMGGIAGHAGLFSNIDDMSVLVQLLLNNGIFDGKKIIDSEVIKSFEKKSKVDESFGLGWRILSHETLKHIAGSYVGDNTIGHTGFTGTVTLIDRKNELGIILLTNKIHTRCVHRQDYLGNSFNTGKYFPVINEIYRILSDV